jgi:MarR family transcriptional regulator, transcriptional regulator for hemolysin
MREIAIPPVAGPPPEPLGMLIARVGKRLDRAFDDALSEVGGSRPAWLILLAVKTGARGSQSAIAERVGISGPTLIHHLDRLEADGLIRRRRDKSNRRVQDVALTASGDRVFMRLRETAVAFDRRLHSGLTDRQTAQLRRLLSTISANIAPEPASKDAHRGGGARRSHHER